MNLNIKIKGKVDLFKLNGCNHPDITEDKRYLVNYSGNWIYGRFNKEWYGWSFGWFGSVYAGIQLDSLTEVWEIEIFHK